MSPTAGMPSPPLLAASVSDAGGLGIVPAGHRGTAQLREDLAAAREITARPFGVGLYVGGGHAADPERFEAYALRLAAGSDALGVRLGEPRFADDAFMTKVSRPRRGSGGRRDVHLGPAVVPVIETLNRAGSEVWLTVGSLDEARRAAARGADALIVGRVGIGPGPVDRPAPAGRDPPVGRVGTDHVGGRRRGRPGRRRVGGPARPGVPGHDRSGAASPARGARRRRDDPADRGGRARRARGRRAPHGPSRHRLRTRIAA